jgi:pullulanase
MHFRKGLLKAFLSLAFLGAMVLAVAPGASPGLPGVQGVAAAEGTTVIVHYHRFAGDYTGWNLWLWPFVPVNGAGAEYDFSGSDAWGEVATANVPGLSTQVGLIVRQGEWVAKDISEDRHVDTPDHHAEIWLLQNDPTIYTTLSAAQAALADASKIKPVNAFLDGTNWIALKMSNPLDLSTVKSGDFAVRDMDSGKSIAATAFSDLSGNGGTRSDLIKVTLASVPAVTDRLQIAFQTFSPLTVVPRLVLDDAQYMYNGNDLGATYSASSTAFRLWAPLATAVRLSVYTDQAGTVKTTVPMTRSDSGTWLARVSGDLKNMYYDYQVTNFGQTATAVDPYATGIAVNGKYGMIVDLKSTDPSGWSKDAFVRTKSPTDATIYETHVRDFSINPDSGMKYKGKYLAFTETKTKTSKGISSGVASLKQLGVNYVEMQPVFGCATLDEVAGGSSSLVTSADGSKYNWCYDPRNYNVPNGAYATNPEGTSRITELKRAIQALHKQGMGVILDVVYNHTSGSAVFDNIVPGYYYRTDYTGAETNGSGTGNEIAAERPMVRKFILDSLKYWTTQYHVDGYRFDLMALLGHDTMKAASQELHAINPHVVIFGEPWTGGTSGLPTDEQVTKGVQQDLGIGVFNDDLRNGVANEVFNSNKDYATGDPTKALSVMIGAVGETNYNTEVKGWAAKPSEDINYVTSHDNKTLWDRIQAADPTVDEATRIKMDEFAQSIIFTSQGVPFMSEGEEFLRTKGGNDNSYISGDTVNMLDWNRKATYPSVFSYYATLIHLRAAHPAFRMNSASMIRNHLTFDQNPPTNLVVYTLTGHANKDRWKSIMVIHNPNPTATSVNLGKGTWKVVAEGGKIALKAFATATGTISAPGYGTTILYK